MVQIYAKQLLKCHCFFYGFIFISVVAENLKGLKYKLEKEEIALTDQ